MNFANSLLRITEKLGLQFAPLDIPFKRRIQTLAAASWFVIMVFGGFMGLILSAYLILYTSLWWLTIIYLLWAFVYDSDTCETGGRRSKVVRNWIWWKFLKEYFPAHLERAEWVELDPKENYLFCGFPHGMICAGPFCAMCSDYGGFKDLFPRHTPYMLTLGQHFSMPFFRELALWLGACKSSAKSIEYLLTKPDGGNVVTLMVGGASEAFYCRPGQYKIVYSNRKGFIKLAMKLGTSLVPVISFGETDLFDQVQNPEGSLLRKMQELLKKCIGLAFAVPVGRGFFQYNYGMVPKRKPVTTVVGKPMKVEKVPHPTNEQIDEVHEKFKQHLISFFEQQKYIYVEDPENTKLEIL